MNNLPQQKSTTSSHQDASDPGRSPWVRCFMQVLWPAFLGATITVGLLFSLIDPVQIEWVIVHLNASREAAYTAAFVFFWIVFAVACSLTWYLATTESPDIRAK